MKAQVELLRIAVELGGGRQAVADALHVPVTTFERWLAGKARMPERLLPLVIDLVAKRNGKPARS